MSADDSDAWVSRTAETYRALRAVPDEDPSRPRLAAFLDVATSERMRKVGIDQTITELNEVIHKASG